MEHKLRSYIETITQKDNVSFSVEKMVGDASSREYYRVHLHDHEPASVVAMVFNPDEAFKSEEASSTSANVRKFPFLDVGQYLLDGGVRVPRFLLPDIRRGVLFLEDLGDVQMFSLVHNSDAETRLLWYKRAIDALLDFQNLTATKPDNDCVAFSREFTNELLLWECDHFLEWGVEALYRKTIPQDDREIFGSEFERLCAELRSMPQVIVHRDFQTRNLMVLNGELVLIDFQDALWGPLPYDLVALLRDSYVFLQPELVEELIVYFVDSHNSRSGSQLDLETFRESFLLQTVQRKLKDSGRFVFIDRVKNNPSFLAYIPDSLAYVKWALERIKGYDKLIDLLGKYEPRLKI